MCRWYLVEPRDLRVEDDGGRCVRRGDGAGSSGSWSSLTLCGGGSESSASCPMTTTAQRSRHEDDEAVQQDEGEAAKEGCQTRCDVERPHVLLLADLRPEAAARAAFHGGSDGCGIQQWLQHLLQRRRLAELLMGKKTRNLKQPRFIRAE